MGAMTGGCACGRVRYAAEVDEAYPWHCRMFPRSTGSVSTNRVQIAEAPGRRHLQEAA